MKVSIITVTYNSESTLQDTINSVQKQNYHNIEYIIVDGSSVDRTVEIIKQNSNVISKWISEPDNGIYDAMNKGIKMATGDIIGIINSDDFYNYSTAIYSIVNVFKENHEIDSVFADVRFIKGSNLNRTIRYYSSKKFKPILFRLGFMPAHPTFFVRKDCFQNFGLYKTHYKISADFELMMRFLFIHKIKYKYLSLDLISMRLGGVSTVSWKSTIILNKEIIMACRENGIYTHPFLLSIKYFVKIFGLIYTR